ncbi:MAG: hypothetical protein SOV27_02305, partial [Eubacteriales bacterium]|nr:hypothetical protein [Eubacteriales bacterium]
MIKYENLTPKAQEDYQSLIKDKMNAFDLLIANYNSEQGTDIDSNKIVTRLQSQYVVSNGYEKSLRLSKEWYQNEFYQPNSVNVDVTAVTSGRYSSFALLKANDNFKTDFPLDDDYAKEDELFNDQIYSDASFAIELARIKDKLGLDIKQSKIVKTTTYKHNLINKAIIKVQNLALHVFKKPLKISGQFSGKMELKTRYSNQYIISNVEKLAKVYDTILGVATKNEAKNYKKKLGKKSKEITFASQLFADVLMSRICNLKSKDNNKKLEACYWLQFANTLNRYGFSAEQLKLITEIGTKATANLCKQLGITTDEIVVKMQKLGYAYNVVPSDEFQALLCVKQKDYEMYKGGYEEVNDETSKQSDEELNIAKGVLYNDETTLKEEGDNKTEDSKTNKLDGEEVNETEENNTAGEQSDKQESVLDKEVATNKQT